MRIFRSQNPDAAAGLKLLNGEDELLKPVQLSYAVEYGDWDMLSFLTVFIQDRVASGLIEEMKSEWFDRIAEQ